MDNKYVNFMPYDQQMAELQRRQRMAELMAQQANAPLEAPQSGRIVAKVSPLAGLAKLLQAYNAGAEQRSVEKQRGEVEQQGRTEALDYLRSFNPERKTIGMGEAFAAQMPTPQIGNTGQVSYKQPQPLDNQRMIGGIDQPMQMQVGGPLSKQAQISRAEEGLVSSNPLVRALAQSKYELASKPVNFMDFMEKPNLDKATPESKRAYMASIASGNPDPSLLVFPDKSTAPHTVTIDRNGKPVVIDVVTGKEIGAAYTPPREQPAPTLATVMVKGNPTVIDARTGRAIGLAVKESKSPTDEQAKAAGFYERMKTANQQIETANYSPEVFETAITSTPLVGNKWASEQRQLFNQSRDNFINALLRRESGAVIGPDEYKSAERQYFPVPGDTEKVLAQKALNRKQAIESMKISAGSVPVSEMTVPPVEGVPPGAVRRIK